jgi:hypothetical protein
MTVTTSCKLAALATLALALGATSPAGAMPAPAGPAPTMSSGDLVLVAQRKGAKRGGANKQQMQGAKKFLPAEYQQYLGGGAGGAGGMGGGGMGGGGMGGGGMGGMSR